jgi:hypothetical protein
MKKRALTLKLLPFAGLAAFLTGCDFTPNAAGQGYNTFIIGIGIVSGLVLGFFVVLGIVSAFYKGNDLQVKVVKKVEPKVLRGNMMGRGSPGYRGNTDTSRRARRQKGRIRYSKITVELEDGREKVIRCNDVVLFDKLLVGKTQKIRIRFGEIIKILK